ncbi:MAG: hypothetical protein EPO25_10765, partial [Gammaproteobacteria bacterium]
QPARTIELVAPFADLQVEVVVGPESVAEGGNAAVAWRVRNLGDTATDVAAWTDYVYLSTDPVLDAGDTLVAQVAHSGALEVGATYTGNAEVAVPFGQLGDFWLIVHSDATGQVFESAFEGNNVTAALTATTLTGAPAPDLAVQTVNAPADAAAGDAVAVSWVVANIGEAAPTVGWNDRVYLSVDGTLTGAVLLATVSQQRQLAAGASYEASTTVTLPDWVDGSYRLLVVSDALAQVYEHGRDSNNSGLSAPLVLGHPDLAVTAVTAPSAAQSGDVIDVGWTVDNQGPRPVAGSWVDRVYLSEDGVIGAGDRLLGEVARSGPLEAGTGYTGALQVTLPVDVSGDWQILVRTDAAGAVHEANAEDDNTGAAPIAVTLAPYADLRVSEVTAPAQTIGDPAWVTIGWTVTNEGTGAGLTGAWTDRIIVSGNDVLGDGDDRVIGSFDHSGLLAVGASYARSERLMLPAGFTGRYHLFVLTDATAAVFENGSEANNAGLAPEFFDVMPIGYANLQVTTATVAATAESGGQLAVSWRVDNTGIARTNSLEWRDTVWLAANPDGTGVLLTREFDHLGALAAGAGYDRSVLVDLPNGVTGTYYVFVRTGGPFEFIYTGDNTTLAGETIITLAPSADLVVTDITAPEEGLEGRPIEVTWTVRNQGDADAGGSWYDTVVLRRLDDPTSAPIVLGSFAFANGLGQGLSYTRTERFTVPMLVGSWRIEITTNAGRALYEHGAAAQNNFLADDRPITLSVNPRPDLQVEALTAPASTAAGATIEVSFDVVNRGAVAATGQWQDRVYLSLDGQLDASDLLLGSIVNGSALGFDESYRSGTDALQIPIRFRGNGFIIVRADAGNAIDEFPNDGNNTLVQAIYVEPYPPADLVTSNVVAPAQAIYGSEIEVRFTVTNHGSATTSAGQWTDTVWLTRDRTRPNPAANGGILLGTYTHDGALAVGESYERIVRVRIPENVESGTWYITPWSDAYDVVLEDTFAHVINPDDPNELDNNNYKARPIDLIGRSPALPDLRVLEVQADATGSANAPFTVRWTVENHGEGDASGATWVDTIYVSDLPDINAPGAQVWLLGEFTRPQGLAPLGRYTTEQTLQLSPAVTGRYVTVVSDPGRPGAVAESDEFNNSATTTTEISTPPADLQVVGVQAPASGFSGELVVVNWTVNNAGGAVWNGARYWRDGVWISRYPTLDARATFAGYQLHDNSQGLAAGGSYTAELEVALPAGADGPFFVFVMADVPWRGQPDEDTRGWNQLSLERYAREAWEPVGLLNNVHSTMTEVVYREADLVVSGLTLVPDTADSGSQVSASFTVTNEGTRQTRTWQWTDRVYLSRDPALDSGDFELGEFLHEGALDAGASYGQSLQFTLPEGIEGEFYVLVYADSDVDDQVLFGSATVWSPTAKLDLRRDRVAEYRGEGNNITAAPLHVDLRPAPDLQVAAVTIPERVIAGQFLSLSYRVENRGAGDTPATQGSWEDRIYLSADAFLDINADRYLGSVSHGGGLAAGAGYDREAGPLRLPAGLVGSYYVFVLTDPPGGSRATGQVFEAGLETNNATASAQPLLIELPPPADLVVDSITTPAHGTVNAPITVSWTVTNQAGNPAQGSWSDSVYLSLDDQWDLSDRLLGRVAHSGGLAAGGSYVAELANVLLPPALAGQYRIIVRSDIFNEVHEAADEGNNARASADPLEIEVPVLVVGVTTTTALATGQERLYKVTVAAGETLRVTLGSGEAAAANEIFIRYNALPDGAHYDAAFTDPLQANQSVVLPATQAGDYYVLVRQFSGPAQPEVGITAELLPFQVSDISVDQGGDGRWVTVTVTGARFGDGALLKLVRPGIEELEPVRYEVVDATRIIATFDLREVTLGLYDIAVVNPGGARATLPYRFLVERVLPTDVSIGLGGPRVLPAGETGLYGISLQSLTNVDTPYVYFEFGIPEMGENQKIYGLPYLSYTSNVGGAPDGARGDVPWVSLDAELNRGGYMMAPGYALDVAAGGYVGLSFAVSTYPGLQALIDRDLATIRTALESARNFWSPAHREALIGSLVALASTPANPDALRGQLNLSIASLLDALETATPEETADLLAVIAVLQGLAAAPNVEIPHKCVPLFAPFRFNVFAAATPLTRDEFIVRQTAEALALRDAILADATASVALVNLAADADAWVASWLAALEDGGLLRPEDEAPPIRTQPKVVSTLAILGSGVLIGPAGQQVRSTADLVAFFGQVRQWYGDTPGQLAPIAGWDERESDECGSYDIPIPELPEFADHDLGLSHETHFATFNVFSPWGSAPDSAYASVAASGTLTELQLQELFRLATENTTQASIIGPQGAGEQQFLPAEQTLPYTIRFENPADAAANPSEIRIVTQLDPALSARSFRLGSIRLGDISINVPAGRAMFQADFDLRNSRGYVLRVSAGIDTATGIATWLLQAIDPATGELVQDPAVGLLPPNDAQGHGAGMVSYTVTSAFGLEANAQVRTAARILFNTAAPFDTPELVQRLDVHAPATTLAVQTLGSGTDYEVRWTAVDDAGGSGVKHTTVYVAVDGGAWQIWQRQSTESLAVFSGEAGHRYEFIAVSTDHAGNQERPVTSVLPDDGSAPNLGALPEVGASTQDVGEPPAPAPTPSTNALFLEAQQGVPAGATTRPSQYGAVLAPFQAEVFATGIGQSHAGVGPLAILVGPDGSVVVSGGSNRGALYRFDETGGRALNPFIVFDEPIYDLAYDRDGQLWAVTGGGELLQLDPAGFAILGRYGESLTQALAVDPGSGELYVSSGDGIEIFDPHTHQFRHFSNYRVDDLAFAPDGALWATSWPARGDVVTFDARGRAQVELRFDDAVDSLAFGRAGTALAGLLFLSGHPRPGIAAGASLVMVDLATRQRVDVATGGPLAESLALTADGRLLIANSAQVDVLAPVTAPAVVSVLPADGTIVPLPLTSITVTFDRDMNAGGPGEAGSVLNPANYELRGAGAGVVAIASIVWDQATRTATLGFEPLQADEYTLTVRAQIRSDDGLALRAASVTEFIGVQDFSSLVQLEFLATRSSRADGTLSFDVRVTNITDYHLRAPLALILDPGLYFEGSAVGAEVSGGGLWLLDVGAGLPNGVLAPGESTIVRTVTLENADDQRADLGYGLYAIPYANRLPEILTAAPTAAQVGQPYSYTVAARDPDGVVLSYVLLQGPDGMSLDAGTGLLSWTPTATSDAATGVVLRAYDTRGGFATQSFTIAVEGGNHAPQLLRLPAGFELASGTLFQLGLDATDPDGQPVTLFVDHLPPGAIYDAGTRLLSWVPGYDQAGRYDGVRIVASDGLASTVHTLTLLVQPANAAPLIGGVPARTVREGDPIAVRLAAIDPNGDEVRFQSPNLPAGATLNPLTGEFEWTPRHTQAGVWDIAFWATDGVRRSETLFHVEVSNVNGAPVFDRLDSWNVAEGQGISFRAFAFDPDNPEYLPQDRLPGGELTELIGAAPSVAVTVEGLPPGASFDPETLLFTWTPDFGQAGQYLVRFTATDDGDGTGVPQISTIDILLTVQNANRAPVIVPTGNVTVARGDTLDIPLDISDPDGNALIVTAEGLPRFAELVTLPGGERILRVAPGVQDRGDYVVTLTVIDDGDGGGARMVQGSSYTLVITAESPSETPLLAPIGDAVAVLGQALRIELRASDLDQDALSWSADSLPVGATLTPGASYGTAVFEWTPAVDQAGEYFVSFRVTDDGNGGAGPVGSAERTVRIVARAANAAPLLLPVGDQQVAEGEALSVQVRALDSDDDALFYSATGLPAGARLDGATGLLTFAPGWFQQGLYDGIVISVSDGAATVTENIAIEVLNTNRPPLLAGLAPLGGQEQRLLQFRLRGNDPDGDVLLYSLAGYTKDGVAGGGSGPAGVLFNAQTGAFEWTPTYAQAGEYVLTFRASDRDGAADTLDVVVRIADVNRAPVLELHDRQTSLGVPLAFRIIGTDPDAGETLQFSAEGLPEGATLDALTGEFRWTPGPGQAGDYLMLVSLSDGKTTTVRPLTLRATLAPEPPTAAIELTPGFPVAPGQSVTVTVLADAFSGVVGCTLLLDGAPVALDGQHRAILSAPATGVHLLSATVTDRDGLMTTVEQLLRVRDPADVNAPAVLLDAGLVGERLAAASEITGQVVDTNLEEWRLEIARAGSERWTLLAEGNTATSGLLATLDPARFESGFYVLRLSARDIAGRAAEVSVSVELAAAQKQGQYLRSEADFSFTLAGHTLEFARRFDSLTAVERGSFGFGWSLALRDVRLETNVPLTGSEASGVFSPLQQGSRLYLTTPTGERLAFTFAPQAGGGSGLSWWTPAWVADGDHGWQLHSFDQRLQRGSNRFYDLQSGAPYNPAALIGERAQYLLIAPDGTRYEIAAADGITAIVFTDGVRLEVSDSGISGPGNENLRWIRGADGALRQVITPDGRTFIYSYDRDGNLEAARNLEAASSQRYGYALPAAHLLTVTTGAAGGEAIEYSGAAVASPLAADLGAALAYLAAPRVESYAGETQLFSLVTRGSEVALPANGAVLLGVVVEATGGSGFVPAVPELAGHTAIASRVEGGRAFALYRIESAALDLLRIAGSGSGDYTLRLFVAGDLDRDGDVDGVDAGALAELRRTDGFAAAADFDDDGQLTASDTQLLFAMLGYSANQAPAITSAGRRTYVDLERSWDLSSLISDPENDPLVVGIGGATHGSARIGGDGCTLYFMPEAGYVGTATVTLYADDGYTRSAPVALTIDVSDARLQSIDFDLRAPQLRLGDQWLVQLSGDFTDEQDVPLPLGYVTIGTLDPAIAALNGRGELVALTRGTTVLTATRGEISAATAVSAGPPESPREIYTYYFGIDAYPDSIALLAGESRQMVVQWGDGMYISAAAEGTHYVVGDSSIAEVTADGRITAKATGTTTVTVINRSGEQVVPVAVVVPTGGGVGEAGGVVLGPDGQMIGLGAGQVEDGTTVTITTLGEAELAMPVPEIVDFAAAFHVEVQGSGVEGPMQIAVPVGPEFAPGETVYFFVEVESELSGTLQKYWAAIDAGVVGEDGYARTTSPPWPGLSQNGNILMARANQPLRTVTLDLGALQASSVMLFMGMATGSVVGMAVFSAAAIATITFPMVYQGTIVRLYASFADQTVEIEVPVDVGQDTTRIRVRVPAPAVIEPEAPLVTSVDFDALTGLLTIRGSEFGTPEMLDTDVRVTFIQGGDPVYVTGEDLIISTVDMLQLRIPPSVVLGISGIYVERAVRQIVAGSGGPSTLTQWKSSERITIDNPGGYGFVGSGSELRILDLQLLSESGEEQVVKILELDGQQIRHSLTTPDLSRAFVAVAGNETDPGAIWVIDGVSLEKVDILPDTDDPDPIRLPYQQSPTGLALDPKGRYLYVAMNGAVAV